MRDPMEREPREEKLPAWAREMIRGLRDEVRGARRQAGESDEENRRLRSALSKGSEARQGADDTFLLTEEGDPVPLGRGCDIGFGTDYTAGEGAAFTVRYGAHEMSGGAPVLTVSADQGSLAVRPTGSAFEVIVCRAQ